MKDQIAHSVQCDFGMCCLQKQLHWAPAMQGLELVMIPLSTIFTCVSNGLNIPALSFPRLCSSCQIRCILGLYLVKFKEDACRLSWKTVVFQIATNKRKPF